MYVRDLEPGCLLDAEKPEFVFALRPLDPHWPGAKELYALGVHHQAAIMPAKTALNSQLMGMLPAKYAIVSTSEVGIFMNDVRLKTPYAGLYKHYILLINDHQAVVDGYQFRDLKKVC